MKKNDWITSMYYHKRYKALQKKHTGEEANYFSGTPFVERLRTAGRRGVRYLLFCFLLCLFLVLGTRRLFEESRESRLKTTVVKSDSFRKQWMDSQMLELIKTTEKPGEFLGLYWLETAFSQEEFLNPYDLQTFQKLKKDWEGSQDWEAYRKVCEALWNDLTYFPVPEPSNGVEAGVSFVDSWMFERSYGGKRGHEGTDIMAAVDERGRYPVVSMTDGVIRHKGWLEKGGYRLGIVAPGGAYFYYAHLDSYADLEEGDSVKAGDLLGFMGDTGYSKVEGTTGNFPVHLHVGIYLVLDGEEISYNPYYALRFLEDRKIRCAYPTE